MGTGVFGGWMVPKVLGVPLLTKTEQQQKSQRALAIFSKSIDFNAVAGLAAPDGT
jgi:hypothetical protein